MKVRSEIRDVDSSEIYVGPGEAENVENDEVRDRSMKGFKVEGCCE